MIYLGMNDLFGIRNCGLQCKLQENSRLEEWKLFSWADYTQRNDNLDQS